MLYNNFSKLLSVMYKPNPIRPLPDHPSAGGEFIPDFSLTLG